MMSVWMRGMPEVKRRAPAPAATPKAAPRKPLYQVSIDMWTSYTTGGEPSEAQIEGGGNNV